MLAVSQKLHGFSCAFFMISFTNSSLIHCRTCAFYCVYSLTHKQNLASRGHQVLSIYFKCRMSSLFGLSSAATHSNGSTVLHIQSFQGSKIILSSIIVHIQGTLFFIFIFPKYGTLLEISSFAQKIGLFHCIYFSRLSFIGLSSVANLLHQACLVFCVSLCTCMNTQFSN